MRVCFVPRNEFSIVCLTQRLVIALCGVSIPVATLHSAITRSCQEKKITKQKKGVTVVKCWQNDCHWPILLGQWQHTADNKVILQKWFVQPLNPFSPKASAVRNAPFIQYLLNITQKDLFNVSWMNQGMSTLQPQELNTHSKSITISEPFYRFYPVLLWQPTVELPLACCYSSWCASCNSYRHTVPRQLEDSWGIPNSMRALTFWVYWPSTAVCSTSGQDEGTCWVG